MNLYDDLIAYWPMNEGSGTVVNSLANNLNDDGSSRAQGTFTDTTNIAWASSGNGGLGSWSGGGKGLKFSGNQLSGVTVQHYVDDVLYVGPYGANRASGLTVAAWIKTPVAPATADYKYTILTSQGSTNTAIGKGQWNFWVTTAGKVSIYLQQYGVIATSTTGVCDGNSHHVAFTFTQSTGVWQIYVDGVADGSGTWAYQASGSAFTLSSQLGYSNYYDSEYQSFKGTLGPIGVWARPLAVAEIACIKDGVSFAPLTYALAGFKVPLNATAADLNALWTASPLSASNVCGSRTWYYVQTCHPTYGEDILTAIKAIVDAGYGTSEGTRAALIVPNGTYSFPAKTDASNPVCPNGLLCFDGAGRNGLYIDLIGESRDGTVLTTDRNDLDPVHLGGGGQPTNYPVLYSSGMSLICHMTLIREYAANGSYCIHDDAHRVNPHKNIFFDLRLVNQTQHPGIGTGTSSSPGESYYICCTGNTNFYAHNVYGNNASASKFYMNNCSVDEFDTSRNRFDGSTVKGFEFQSYKSSQPDQVVVLGGNVRGSQYSILVDDGPDTVPAVSPAPTWQSSIYVDGVGITGIGQDALLTNESISSNIKHYQGMGGTILMVDPPMRASVIFARDDSGYSSNVSDNLRANVTVDDVVGTGIVNTTDLLADLPATLLAYGVPKVTNPDKPIPNDATSGAVEATVDQNASNFTGRFPAAVLANAPTGPTYNLSGVAPIGSVVPLPLVVQQYCSINLTIPLAQAVAGDTVQFVVTSMTNRTTILWQYAATVSENGLSVNVTADDTNTQTPPPNGWYWYLVDTTTKLRIGEGPLTLDAGPLVT